MAWRALTVAGPAPFWGRRNAPFCRCSGTRIANSFHSKMLSSIHAKKWNLSARRNPRTSFSQGNGSSDCSASDEFRLKRTLDFAAEGRDCSDENFVSSVILRCVSVCAVFSVLFCVPEQASAFSLFGEPRIEKDPVEPFTFYGSVLKKYLIEIIEDGKIVGRKKGFTASVCLNILNESRETPELQGVPPGLKVNIIGEPCCAKGEGQGRDDSCSSPCQLACNATLDRHLAEVKRDSGYSLDPEDKRRALKSCIQSCTYECTKPGKSSSFVLPLRFSR